jgi:SAM-dependent methyltransferase
VRRCATCGLRRRTASQAVRLPGQAESLSYVNIDTAAYLHSIGRVRAAQAREIVSFVTRHGGHGQWLDIGCGFGFVLEAARAAGFDVRGIEPNADAARAARERVGNVDQGLLEESTAGADVLSTLDVIEHLDDLDAFANLVKRKVTKLWVIKVPSADGLFFKVATAFGITSALKRLWQSDYESPHTVYFDQSTLTRFLGNHGFDVVAARYLDEVPTSTVVDRLTLDGRMRRWMAMLALPAFFTINLIERLRGKSDALVVLARPRGA